MYLVSSELTSVLWFMSINGEISNRIFPDLRSAQEKQRLFLIKIFPLTWIIHQESSENGIEFSCLI